MAATRDERIHGEVGARAGRPRSHAMSCTLRAAVFGANDRLVLTGAALMALDAARLTRSR